MSDVEVIARPAHFEETYNKCEIDLMFKNIDQKLDGILEVTNATHEQAKKTNGRVNKLENWRWFLTGITTVIIILIIPMLREVFTLSVK